MQYRKDPLALGETYHIYSRSISMLAIFTSPAEYDRMLGTLLYYQRGKPTIPFSRTLRYKPKTTPTSLQKIRSSDKPKFVQIVCYCLMPTHLHLILKQLTEGGISAYMALILNSYTRYFNIRHHRKGPLWEGRFKDVRVKTDEQLLHLTRYIHLNPVTAYMVGRPEEWGDSSYREYISGVKDPICEFKGLLNIDPARYRVFVEDRADYQRRLGDIKRLLLEEPCAPQKWA